MASPDILIRSPASGILVKPIAGEAKRTVTATAVIVWEVGLEGVTIEPKPRHISALMRLTNCGEVIVEESYISADPIR
jgi:hypothetical protein